ncbi:hypothetical protein ZIOFF_062820 [Zingiber officinale]|uniref:Transposase n=1 Tax=Zingiber officinale TaxID=94328 RepID=A0A8J5F5V3_ZINOF|nr:hypothetical protein ZIOFF_062820 [Zingiber officinale]
MSTSNVADRHPIKANQPPAQLCPHSRIVSVAKTSATPSTCASPHRRCSLCSLTTYRSSMSLPPDELTFVVHTAVATHCHIVATLRCCCMHIVCCDVVCPSQLLRPLPTLSTTKQPSVDVGMSVHHRRAAQPSGCRCLFLSFPSASDIRVPRICSNHPLSVSLTPTFPSSDNSHNHRWIRSISTITIDNCSTNDSLKNYVMHKLDHSTLILGGSLFHMHYVAHILNLVVQDDLDVIAPSVEKIRESVTYWRASPKREQKFDDVAHIIMLSKFEKYWSDIHGVMGIATILDPKYKTKLVEYCFKRTHGEIYFREPVRKIQKMCYDLLQEYTDNNGHASVEKRSMETRLNTSSDDFLDSFDKEVALEYDNNTYIKTELDHYLEDKVLPRNVDFDILEWWKTNGIKYPTSMRMAQDLLVIPISTVASESAFSTSGRLVSPRRSRLHPKPVEVLICTQTTTSQETEAYYSSIEYDEDTIDIDGY